VAPKAATVLAQSVEPAAGTKGKARQKAASAFQGKARQKAGRTPPAAVTLTTSDNCPLQMAPDASRRQRQAENIQPAFTAFNTVSGGLAGNPLPIGWPSELSPGDLGLGQRHVG
jgi:hypothetical protein